MTNEMHYYDIYPKVFPAGKEITITIKPLGYHAEFENPENVIIKIFGLDDGNPEIILTEATAMKFLIQWKATAIK